MRCLRSVWRPHDLREPFERNGEGDRRGGYAATFASDTILAANGCQASARSNLNENHLGGVGERSKPRLDDTRRRQVAPASEADRVPSAQPGEEAGPRMRISPGASATRTDVT